MDLREGILQRRSAVADRLSPYRLRPVEMPQRHIIKSLQNGDIHLVESPDGNLLRLALDRPRHKLMGNQNVADVRINLHSFQHCLYRIRIGTDLFSRVYHADLGRL